MAQKNCPVCDIQFEFIPGRRGYEQVYCSPKCRKKAGKLREVNKYMKPHSDRPISEPIQYVNGGLQKQIKPDYSDITLEAMGDAEKWRRKYDNLLDRYNDLVQEMESQNSIILAWLDRIEKKLL